MYIYQVSRQISHSVGNAEVVEAVPYPLQYVPEKKPITDIFSPM